MYPSLLVKSRSGSTEFPWTQPEGYGIGNYQYEDANERWDSILAICCTGIQWQYPYGPDELILMTLEFQAMAKHDIMSCIKPIIFHVIIQRIASTHLSWICMCFMLSFSFNNYITKTLAFLVVGCQTRRPLWNSLGLWPKAQRTFLNRPYALHMRVTSPSLWVERFINIK